MPRLAANLSTLFTELPFTDRFAAAAAAGFRYAECQFPYVVEPAVVAAASAAASLPLVLFNAPPGDAAAGERGLASLPGREPEFRASIGRMLDYARATGTRRIHVMAGMAAAGIGREAQTATFVDNLRWAADAVRACDVTLLIEPINTRVDVPGYFLEGTAQAVQVLERVGRDNVRLQFDVYHLQIMEGDLARSLGRLLPWIGHVQIADNPGRHEPGTGEIAFPWLLRHLDALGYDGYVGCEYLPSRTTAESLRWAEPWLGRGTG